MIDPQTLIKAFESGFRPLPGKVLIECDSVPTMAGLLHLPESTQELRSMTHVQAGSVYGDTSWTGKVLAVTPRRNERTGEFIEEDFQPGDRVWFMLLNEDMNQKVIVTTITRIIAARL